MQHPAYTLHLPERTLAGLLLASPHSGRDYPSEFIAQSPLSPHQLRSSEDAFVDLLWADGPDHGVPLICARAPRAYVDLNRAADEFDPALIEGLKRGPLNPRVASGLGVIPRVVSGGRVIHPGRISQAEADQRLATHWHPWHSELRSLLQDHHRRFGASLLIDCHSMPHEAVAGLKSCDGLPPQVVLGDRHGSSCAPALMQAVEQAFCAAGFRTARNIPFAGAWTAQNYGRPAQRRHAIQVEIDRSLYMDEASILPNAHFAEIRARLSMVTRDLVRLLRQGGAGEALAAE